jgi:DNA-binding transcriptional MocR family regulator
MTLVMNSSLDPGFEPVRGTERIKYLGVMDAVERVCANLSPGERLPPHRSMAADFGITVATLTRAVSELRRRGVLVTRTGAGTFVAPRTNASHATGASDAIADLRLNVPSVEPVRDLLRDTLGRLDGAQALFEYEPLGGSLAARQAGAAWLRLRGLSPTPDQVLVVSGAHEGLLAALRAVTSPGDRVLCEALHYAGLRQMATLLRIELVGVPIDNRGLDVEAFARLCRDVAPRAAVLTPETQNPTTISLHTPERRAVVAAARQADMILIEDDIFGHFAGEDEPPLARLAPERTIFVTSLSKSIAPGMRLGHLIAPAPLQDAMENALSALGWTCSALYSAIAQRLISEGTAQLCLRAQRTEALQRARLARQYLGEAVALADDGLNGPKPSYHAWLTLPPGRRADRFAAELVARQVLISPAYHFAQTELPAPEAVRIALGYGNREMLESALQRIAAVLKQTGPGITSIV